MLLFQRRKAKIIWGIFKESGKYFLKRTISFIRVSAGKSGRAILYS